MGRLCQLVQLHLKESLPPAYAAGLLNNTMIIWRNYHHLIEAFSVCLECLKVLLELFTILTTMTGILKKNKYITYVCFEVLITPNMHYI